MPSKPPSQVTLLDIPDAIYMARQWTAGQTFDEFALDRKTVFAVTRCLEIVSEASRRLPEELRDRHPALPWREIMDAGNVYRHRYDNVEEQIVWDTVHRDIPPMLTVIESELANLSDNFPMDDALVPFDSLPEVSAPDEPPIVEKEAPEPDEGPDVDS